MSLKSGEPYYNQYENKGFTTIGKKYNFSEGKI